MVFGWKVTLLLALSACFGCVRSIRGVSRSKIVRANHFVDDLIRKHWDTLNKYATIELPDFDIPEFTHTLGTGVNFHLKLALVNGSIWNLNQIIREGDCAISADEDIVTLVVNLGVRSNVNGIYHHSIKITKLKLPIFNGEGNVTFTIKHPQLILTIKQSFKKLKDLGPKMTNILNFDVFINAEANIGEIDTNVVFSHKLGKLNWVLAPFIKYFTPALTSQLQDAAKDYIRKMINDISGESLLELLQN